MSSAGLAVRPSPFTLASSRRTSLRPCRRIPLWTAKAAATPVSTNGSPATPAPAIPAPVTPPEVAPPPAAYEKAVALGVGKAGLPSEKILVMGIMAGIMIGYGAFLAASIGGACTGLMASNPGLQKMVFGAFGLPFGLLMVLICGAELFTGNTALVTAAVYEGKATFGQLVKSWSLSYIGNIIGSLLLVYAIFLAGIFPAGAAPAKIAVAKTSLSWVEAFVRGILCNFLVCIGIWQAGAASSLAGKAVGVWFPISAFVALGLEHSVANMFLIPMGIAIGAPVTYSKFLTANLIPVTLGNIIGGAVFVATAYSYIFGKLGKKE